jgi:hypothetical protein
MIKLIIAYICKLNEFKVKHLIIVLLTVILGNTVYGQSNQAQSLDSRAYNYYTAEQVAAMDEVTVAQLNFVFRNSYVLNNEKPCDVCPAIDLSSFDVYNYTRELNTRKRVYITNPGNPIDIMSSVELDTELERIKNEILSSSH